MGQRVGFECMNNDHHNISHGLSLPREISPWYDPRSLSWPPSLVGGKSPPPCFSLPPFIVVSFFLNRVPKVGTCPISLSLQLLGVVVSTEKYDSVRHEALNTIVTAFPLDVFILSVVFSCFIAFPILWNNMECCHWSHAASFTFGHIHPKRILHGEGGIFPWVGPLAQWRQRYGPISLLPPPPHNSPSKSRCSAPRTDMRVLVKSSLCHGFLSLDFH